MNSPWGRVQNVSRYSDEVRFVSTSSHGGFKVTGKSLARMRLAFPGFETFAGGGWFEEDCDAVLVVATLRELFTFEKVLEASELIKTEYFIGYIAGDIAKGGE